MQKQQGYLRWLLIGLGIASVAIGGFFLNRSENHYALQLQEHREKETRKIEERRILEARKIEKWRIARVG